MPVAAERRRPRGASEQSRRLYVVEHLEEGLEEWCRLEYRHICKIVQPSQVLFLRWPENVAVTELVSNSSANRPDSEDAGEAGEGSSADLPSTLTTPLEECGPKGGGGDGPLPSWDRICLLDMDASEALEPEDAGRFDAVVFGGILGNVIENPDGSYGSDDRTSELRQLGFAHRRHLGPMQMTTDTAVLVTRLVLEERRTLADIPFIDSPDISETQPDEAMGTSDCVTMEGFRYVAKRGSSGEWEPTLPEGMRELLLRSADDDILGSM